MDLKRRAEISKGWYIRPSDFSTGFFQYAGFSCINLTRVKYDVNILINKGQEASIFYYSVKDRECLRRQ